MSTSSRRFLSARHKHCFHDSWRRMFLGYSLGWRHDAAEVRRISDGTKRSIAWCRTSLTAAQIALGLSILTLYVPVNCVHETSHGFVICCFPQIMLVKLRTILHNGACRSCKSEVNGIVIGCTKRCSDACNSNQNEFSGHYDVQKTVLARRFGNNLLKSVSLKQTKSTFWIPSFWEIERFQSIPGQFKSSMKNTECLMLKRY